ncbi:MAG: CHAP domain-containing protein [Cystobacterineae bacterium]|nr:CHAP domain-containing protein [Cystobacterineae bacterium]
MSLSIKYKYLFLSAAFILLAAIFIIIKKPQIFSEHKIGEPIDSLNGVVVYYNGPIGNVSGRNLTADNYNLGQKYQCVEFVKRYYYEYYHHKMPDSYGHAKDFFDERLQDGEMNEKRALTQYQNPSQSKPQTGDLLVFGGGAYGHVAIVSDVREGEIEIIQQNPGILQSSRLNIPLRFQDELWRLDNGRVLGWLRKEDL